MLEILLPSRLSVLMIADALAAVGLKDRLLSIELSKGEEPADESALSVPYLAPPVILVLPKLPDIKVVVCSGPLCMRIL